MLKLKIAAELEFLKIMNIVLYIRAIVDELYVLVRLYDVS